MPIDEKEEFDETSQISLWETEKRPSQSILNSVSRVAQPERFESPVVGDRPPKGPRGREPLPVKAKARQLVENPILGSDSNFLKEPSSNKVLEEEHPGRIPKFHRPEREEEVGVDISGIKRARRGFSAARKKAGKGGCPR